MFICLHIVKWFQELLSNTNNFICTQLNGFEYCYFTLAILFNILHLRTVKYFQVLLCNTNNSIQQLNGFKYKKGLNISTWPIDGTLTGTTTPGHSWERLYLSAMMHLAYSTTPADWASFTLSVI